MAWLQVGVIEGTIKGTLNRVALFCSDSLISAIILCLLSFRSIIVYFTSGSPVCINGNFCIYFQ